MQIRVFAPRPLGVSSLDLAAGLIDRQLFIGPMSGEAMRTKDKGAERSNLAFISGSAAQVSRALG
jgi:hypothetical protein